MRIIKAGLILLICLSLCACGARGQDSRNDDSGAESYFGDMLKTEVAGMENEAASFAQMHWEKGMELSYATTFFVEKAGDFERFLRYCFYAIKNTMEINEIPLWLL